MRGLESLQIGAKLGEGWSVERVCERCGELEGECVCVQDNYRAISKHRLNVYIQKRQGRIVTCVGEFFLPNQEMKQFLQKLKCALGSGGTYKDRRIEVQGDKQEAVYNFFKNIGFEFKH